MRQYIVHKCWMYRGGTQHHFSEPLPRKECWKHGRLLVKTKPPSKKSNLLYVVVERILNHDATWKQKVIDVIYDGGSSHGEDKT